LRQLLEFTEQRAKEIQEIDAYFLRQITPKEYGKLEVKVELDFVKTCHILSDHTNSDVKKMTVKEFFALQEVVEKKPPKRVM
jgi:hypothetical protein